MAFLPNWSHPCFASYLFIVWTKMCRIIIFYTYDEYIYMYMEIIAALQMYRRWSAVLNRFEPFSWHSFYKYWKLLLMMYIYRAIPCHAMPSHNNITLFYFFNNFSARTYVWKWSIVIWSKKSFSEKKQLFYE